MTENGKQLGRKLRANRGGRYAGDLRRRVLVDLRRVSDALSEETEDLFRRARAELTGSPDPSNRLSDGSIALAQIS